jgi:hypothetical protein
MWTNGKAIVLSTLLLVTAFAWADNTIPQIPAAPAVQNTSPRSEPRINYLNFKLPDETEKSGAAMRNFRIEGSEVAGKSAPLNIEPPNGLHLTTGDPHPGLVYKFSESGAIRFHVGKSGTAATAGWSF